MVTIIAIMANGSDIHWHCNTEPHEPQYSDITAYLSALYLQFKCSDSNATPFLLAQVAPAIPTQII